MHAKALFNGKILSMKRFILCLSVMISLLLCLPQQCFAVGAEEPDETITVHADYTALTSGKQNQLDVPYSDAWFRQDASVYNHDLARASLCFAVTAFRPAESQEPAFKSEYVQNFLSQAGFSRFRSDDYDRPSGRYTIASEIASKTVEDERGAFTLIAIGIAGQGYGDEWLSNFSIGGGDIHEGFQQASEDIYDRLWGYIAQNHIEAPYKIWVTGFSRSAAVANIFAASLTQDGLLPAKDVFAYTFATPRTTKNPEPGMHDNIFNIVGAVDIVPQIPFKDWGFERYGQTFYTPAQETTSSWYSTQKKANDVYREIVGFDTWNNPVINTQIKILTEYLLEICPDNETYARYLQDDVCRMWTSADSPLELMSVLLDISQNKNLINEENAAAANSLMDYALYSSLEYMTYSNNMPYVEERTSTAMNVLHEHTSEVYISWLFSDTPPEELYTENRAFTRVVLEGDVDIDVCQGEYADTVLETVAADGEITYRSDDVRPFAMRTGEKTVLILPADTRYSLEIHANSDTDVAMTEIDYTSEQTKVTEYRNGTLTVPKDDIWILNVAAKKQTDSVTDKESIQDIRSGSTDTLATIQQFETLNVLNLEWRTFVLTIMCFFFILGGLLIFIVCCTAGKLHYRRNIRAGLYSSDTKYYFLPVFCLCFVFVAFLSQQLFAFLFSGNTNVQLALQVLIDIFILYTAYHGYRQCPTFLNRMNIPALMLFSAANITSIYFNQAGLILRIAGVLVMVYSFARQSRPALSQYIIFGFLAIFFLSLMYFFRRRFGIGLNSYAVLLGANLITSAAMFSASLPMPKMYRRGSLLFLISGISLYAGKLTYFPFLTHLLFAGIYFASLSCFAAASLKIIPHDAAMDIPRSRPEPPAPAESQ